MKLELLSQHTKFIPYIAKLKYNFYHHLNPSKTLQDFRHGLENDISNETMPIGYVIVKNNAFVGMVSLRVCDLNSHSHLTPWLGGLFVDPSHRNQGIGAFLVKEAEKMANVRGFNTLYLYTNFREEWYKKLGWETIEQLSPEKNPVAIMKRDIFS